MREEPFEVRVADGVLRGHLGGTGPPALLLHGGPAVSDYMLGCAGELAELVSTIRYTQRGARPSAVGPPYSIESHTADALRVLDSLGVTRAWAIGHSWGAHLALHLLARHPDRLLGVACINCLGAHDVFAEFGERLRRALTEAQVARLDEIEALRRRGQVTEADLVERMSVLWPTFFTEPERAPPSPITHIGVRCSIETNASIADHFERGTLVQELPSARLPALFVHGADDPLPLRASTDTAALIRGARVETIAACGHVPWLERPGEVRLAVGRFFAHAPTAGRGAGGSGLD